MNYILFDLEATCGEKYQRIRHEIIEIGAVKVNESREIVSEFSKFIRPTEHPTLTPFCTRLTSITQKDIDSADKFPSVMWEFINWIGKEEYVLISWGKYDKNQFVSDCQLHMIDHGWVYDHIDLKQLYATIMNVKKTGMVNTLIREEITLDGTHHRGIDDAKNITKIFLKHFDLWDINKILRRKLV